MSSRIYTTIENLPNALSISLSSALAIYKQPDTFALRLSTTNGLFWTTINPPLSAQLTSLSSTAFVAISALMPLSGGQMTGPLILNNAVPLEALHLASKKYVDDADALHVLRSGDTMVGYLSVNIPNRAGEITPKQYVDNRDVTIVTSVVPENDKYRVDFAWAFRSNHDQFVKNKKFYLMMCSQRQIAKAQFNF
jgi:hypothetical protein